MSTNTYDPGQVACKINGTLITNWNKITVKRDEDSYSYSAGTMGHVTATKNYNKIGTIEIDVPQTSLDNDIISALESAGTEFSVDLQEIGSSTKIGMPQARVMKLADAPYEKESSNRVWTVKGDMPDPASIGGIS